MVGGKEVKLEDGERTAAVEVDDNGFSLIWGFFGPDVQGQAVLASVLVNGATEGSDNLAELFCCFWVRS